MAAGCTLYFYSAASIQQLLWFFLYNSMVERTRASKYVLCI